MSKLYSIPVLLIFLISYATVQFIPAEDFNCLTVNHIPCITNETHLADRNGSDYQPVFIKGMNMSVAVTSKFPGELYVPREQYFTWFQLIRDAGFNSIRHFTLQFPHFYEAPNSFNLANQPSVEIILLSNPTHNAITFSSGEVIENIILFESSGKMLLQKQVDQNDLSLDLSRYYL